MSNRAKVMILILLFWVILQTTLLIVGFPPIPVLGFTLIGSTIFNLVGMYLDIHNKKVSNWFDSTEFFKKCDV